MTIKGYSAFQNLTIRLFSVTSRTLDGEGSYSSSEMQLVYSTALLCRSSVLVFSSCAELRLKVNSLKHQEGKIICTSGHSTRSGYASGHICWPAHWHFCLLADTSQATEPVIIVYYFLLCIRAVASSSSRQLGTLILIYLYLSLFIYSSFYLLDLNKMPGKEN